MSKVQKVYYLTRLGYRHNRQVPHIRLAGDWLKNAGYDINDKICITTNDDGSITIRKMEVM